MLLSRPRGRIIVGLAMVASGVLWTLQGFDLLGQDGGMNGRAEWIVIGIAAVAGGLALAIAGFRARSRP